MTEAVDESRQERRSIYIILICRLFTASLAELEPKKPSVGMKATTGKTSLRLDKHADPPATRRSKEEKKEFIDEIDKIFGF